MAKLGPPPVGIDLTATRLPQIIAVWASSWALAVIATALRFLCRRLTKNRFWLDDWLIVASLVCTGALTFSNIFWKGNHGFGRHIWVAPPEAGKVWAQAYFLNTLLVLVGIFLIKSSILALYWRIFSIEASIRPLIWILFGMVCGWAVACVCLPHSDFSVTGWLTTYFYGRS